MATKFLENVGGAAGDAVNVLTQLKGDTGGNALPIVGDAIDGVIKYYDRVNSVVRQLVPSAGFKPITDTTGAVTATEALHAGRTVVINKVSGGTVQLPLATGSGNKYKFVVGLALTSAQWIISAVVATDVFAGGILANDTGGSAAATADFWPTAATSNTLTMTLLAGGGSIGDTVEFEDIASGVWRVNGVFINAADPATPFSHV